MAATFLALLATPFLARRREITGNKVTFSCCDSSHQEPGMNALADSESCGLVEPFHQSVLLAPCPGTARRGKVHNPHLLSIDRTTVYDTR